jgi:hypothetical protein
LLELGDLFLELGWVHRFDSHLVDVLMSGLELSLKVLVDLEGLSHILVHKELVWDLERYQEFSGIGSSLKLWEFGYEPVKQMLDGLFLSMDYVPLETGIEVAGVTEDCQEAADTRLGLVLGLSLDVDGEMLAVKVAQHPIEHLQQLQGRLVIELHK